MKRSKGFTLIELLAVILILGIIALIAIPTTTNIIKSAKENAAKESMNGYIKAVDFAQAKYQANNRGESTTDVSKLEIDYKGEKFTLRKIEFNSNGDVTNLIIKLDNYRCYYNDGDEKCVEVKKFNLDMEGHLITLEEGMTWQEWMDSDLYSGLIQKDFRGLYYDDGYRAFHLSTDGTNIVQPNKVAKKELHYGEVSCFVAETKVLTSNGLKNIEDIKIVEMVYSYNEQTKSYEYNKVINTHKNLVTKDKTIVKTKTEEIISTSKHKYYTINRGWINAEDLTTHDKLLDNKGNTIDIVDVITEKSNEEYYVYNLTVENVHNFFVGTDSILVHNASAPELC